jgi:predicted glycosyltransferase involved in capsule biosynthesis
MSMDYASKIKNKTIERLNEQFEFITGSTEKFIQTLKSKEDKRIQVIQLIKD